MPVRNHQPLSNCLCKSVHYPSFMNVPSWKAKTHFHIKNYLQMNFFFRNSIPREHRTTDFGVSLSTSSSPRTNWCWSNVERSNPSEWKKKRTNELKILIIYYKSKRMAECEWYKRRRRRRRNNPINVASPTTTTTTNPRFLFLQEYRMKKEF